MYFNTNAIAKKLNGSLNIWVKININVELLTLMFLKTLYFYIIFVSFFIFKKLLKAGDEIVKYKWIFTIVYVLKHYWCSKCNKI